MNSKPELYQKITTTIQRLGINGEGIGSCDGYTVFIDGALPGEQVHARMSECKKNYGRASILNIDNHSPDRAAPPCPLFSRCGGCQLMHYDYNAQLEMKRQRVADALQRIGKFDSIEVNSCVPSPSPLAYRNKIQAAIRPGPQGIRIGFYERNSHDLVDVDHCMIHCPEGQSVYNEVLKLIKISTLTAYDWETKKGELRYLIIKTAVHTGQVLVLFVGNGKPSAELSKIAEEIVRLCPSVKGVVHNRNDLPQNAVLGKEYYLLAGDDHIEETICGLTFNVSPASFFQVNPDQAENLYRKALDFAALKGDEQVIDAFCGVGTLSLIFAQRAKEVVGVECVPQAIEDAQQNAQKNGIYNVRFVCSDAENYFRKGEQADVVLLNPPRKGCESSLLEKIGKMAPEKVVYVSCDPATLARDLAILKNYGYGVVGVQPFDMFPQTAHVETVVCMARE